MADRYSTMTRSELEADASGRTPPVDLSEATTNAARADLLRADDSDGQPEPSPDDTATDDSETDDASTDDKPFAERETTTPSIGPPAFGDQGVEAGGASDPQGRRSRLAATEDEMKERAEYVASSVAQSIAPARAREEAEAARKRAGASDPEQSLVEEALASKLDEIAERHEAQSQLQQDRAKIQNRSAATPLGTSASGPLGEPIPDEVELGSVGVYHTPEGQADTTAMVIGLWNEVPDNDDEPDGEKHRWRLNLELFPMHGSPASIEGVAYGEGQGQFQTADDVKDAAVVPSPSQTPFRNEVR